MQGQRLILVALFVTAAYAVKIDSFVAYAYLPIVGNQSTVEDDRMILWANVTDCEPTECLCEVTGTALATALAVNFTIKNPNQGSVSIQNLQPDTMYSFTLICVGAPSQATLNVTTDYGRPSAPLNIGAGLQSGRVRVSWDRPTKPAGPIHHYRLVIDNNPPLNNLPGDKLFYDMTENYVLGTEYTFVLSACNVNNKKDSVCSNANEGMFTFSVVGTPTPPTKPSFANNLSYSIAFPLWIICTLAFR